MAISALRFLACTGENGAAAAPPPLEGYHMPPQSIVDIVDAPLQPQLSFSPDRKLILQLERPAPHPPITELGRPELKLAGAP